MIKLPDWHGHPPLLSTHPSVRTLDLESSSHLTDTSVLRGLGACSEPQMAAGSTGAVRAQVAARPNSLSFPFVCSRTLWHGCHRLNLKFTVVLRELLVPPPPFILKRGINVSSEAERHLLFYSWISQHASYAEADIKCVFPCCNRLHVINQPLQGPDPAPPSCPVCLY